MFSVHTSPGKFENTTNESSVILDLCLKKTLARKSHDYSMMPLLSKIPFLEHLLSTRKHKPLFSNSSGLKSSFEMLHFLDEVVWTEGRTGELSKAALPCNVDGT